MVQRVDYISDALGFRVAATNLPVAQNVPVEAAESVPASQVTLNKIPALTAHSTAAQLEQVHVAPTTVYDTAALGQDSCHGVNFRVKARLSANSSFGNSQKTE